MQSLDTGPAFSYRPSSLYLTHPQLMLHHNRFCPTNHILSEAFPLIPRTRLTLTDKSFARMNPQGICDALCGKKRMSGHSVVGKVTVW
jgi:hypothetical protein